MAFTNGTTILAADLNGMTTAQLVLMETDTEQLPLTYEPFFTFAGLTATIATNNPELCQASFQAPWDMLIEVASLQVGNATAASVTSAVVTCPGILDQFPISLSHTYTAGIGKSRTVLFDNSGVGPSAALRVIPRGATVLVAITTTSVVAGAAFHVGLVARSYFARF